MLTNYLRGNNPRMLILQSKHPLIFARKWNRIQERNTNDKHLGETTKLLESLLYSGHMGRFHQGSLLQTLMNITNLCLQDRAFSQPTARQSLGDIKPCKRMASSTNLDEINTNVQKSATTADVFLRELL